MANNNLRYELKLDISAVIENLKKTEDRLLQVFGKLKEPVSLDIDSSEAEEALDNINSVDVTISADASDAIASANETEAQINKIPDSKEIKIKADTGNALTGLAKLGLGLNALTSVYGMLNSSLSSFLNLSNTQEKAENDLISALQTKGQATTENIKSYNEFASAMQKVTTTGDEQTLKLLTMSVNMGIAEEKRKEASQGALGLAKAFESAGLTQETALKGIALAYEGEYTQLSRYIPALRTAQTETEKMAILQEAMANGFKMAQDETKTGAGAIRQYQNLVGDLKEKIGDLIKSAILPVISVLTSFASLLNDHPGIFKTAVAAIGSLVVALSAWKVAQIALNLSLTMNPIGLVIVAIGALVAGIAVAINHVGGFAQAWEFVKASLLITWEYMKAFTNALAGSFDIIKAQAQNFASLLKALFTGDFQGAIDIVTNGFTTAFTQSMDRFADAGKKAKEIWEEAGKTAEKAMNPKAYQGNNVILSDSEESPQKGNNVILSDSEESPQQDPIIAAYQKELELLNLKRQNNYEVTEELKALYSEYMQYLKDLYGKDSIEYQQVLNQKINFERDRALKLANIERERLAEERAMQQAAWDFEQERLMMEDPHQARLNQQIKLVEQFYDKRSDLLIKQGYTEEQITAQKNKAIEALEIDSMLNRMKSHGQGLGQMANNLSQFGTLGFNASKALQKAQVIMETPAAAMSAYRAVVGIPIIGQTLAPIAFAAAIATGLRQLSAIDKAKPPKAKMGGLSGLLKGESHENGGILIEAEGDEYIINKNRVKELGTGFFDFLNFSPLSAVKSAFTNIKMPSLPSVPAPSAVMANGGAIVHRPSWSDNNDNPLILKLNETVEQLKELKQALLDKEMTVHNHISANAVIKKADPALISHANNTGTLLRSSI